MLLVVIKTLDMLGVTWYPKSQFATTIHILEFMRELRDNFDDVDKRNIKWNFGILTDGFKLARDISDIKSKDIEGSYGRALKSIENIVPCGLEVSYSDIGDKVIFREIYTYANILFNAYTSILTQFLDEVKDLEHVDTIEIKLDAYYKYLSTIEIVVKYNNTSDITVVPVYLKEGEWEEMLMMSLSSRGEKSDCIFNILNRPMTLNTLKNTLGWFSLFMLDVLSHTNIKSSESVNAFREVVERFSSITSSFDNTSVELVEKQSDKEEDDSVDKRLLAKQLAEEFIKDDFDVIMLEGSSMVVYSSKEEKQAYIPKSLQSIFYDVDKVPMLPLTYYIFMCRW